MYKKIIAIDFDGCLCENRYPDIGEPHWPVIWQAIQEQKNGAILILWTCRCGEYLKNAVDMCATWGLHFDLVNENVPELVKAFGADPRKISATEYWDDRAVTVGAVVARQK